MVWKKSNCPAVNSGNTMRKRLYAELSNRFAHPSNSSIVKRLIGCNVSTEDPKEIICEASWLIVIDDKELLEEALPYSLNKRKRWEIENDVSRAMHFLQLEQAKEQFKITLVHRAGNCMFRLRFNRVTATNVDRYYDSHTLSMQATPNKSFSTRQGMLAKCSNEKQEVGERRRRKLKRKEHHNRHFRGRQRHTYRTSSKEKETGDTDVPTTDDIPEVRYDVCESTLNSLSFYSDDDHFPHRRLLYSLFRGQHRAKVSWYYADFPCAWTTKKGPHHRHTSTLYNDDYSEEYQDADPDFPQYDGAPKRKEFSLSDFATTDGKKLQKKSNRDARCKHTDKNDGRSLVNSASGQRIRKHGKGSAVFLQQEKRKQEPIARDHAAVEEEEASAEAEVTLDDTTPNPESPSVSPFDVDYAREFADFSHSFVPGRVLQSTFTGSNLRRMFGSAVEFGGCIPFTARFDLGAVSRLLGGLEGEREGGGGGGGEVRLTDLQGWWLLGQAGQRQSDGFSSPQHTQEDVIIVHMKLYADHVSRELDGEGDGGDVNQELRAMADQGEGRPLFLSMSTLLQRVCHMLHSRHSFTRSVPCEDLCPDKAMDARLPYDSFVSQVSVCSVTQAYTHLKAAGKVPVTQAAEEAELSDALRMTWCDVQCSVCLCVGEDEDDGGGGGGGLEPFVVATACGHCFCRACWQHHLVARVMEGQTRINCMEYKCATVLDPTVLMSLVPQWAYSRWQHRLQSRAVESSEEWKWCPTPRCTLLARLDTASGERKTRKGTGVPVACQCQQRWCLDCGQEDHWPISCEQFCTYMDMLTKRGHLSGSCLLEAHLISQVQVKRCPRCRYPMEKGGGCRSMVCSQCQQAFCWICLTREFGHTDRHCRWRGDETIELQNNKLYPFPIKFYRMAVTYRFQLHNLKQFLETSVTGFDKHFGFARGRRSKAVRKAAMERISDDALRDAAKELKTAHALLLKGLRLLDLSSVLLSNACRKSVVTQDLCADLPVLEFFCDRLDQYLQQSRQTRKKVLDTACSLRRIIGSGQRLVRHVCFRCHRLKSRTSSSKKQKWLLSGDHERFVNIK